MAKKKKSNFFSELTEKDIRVSYIDPILGLVNNLTICEAKIEAKKNPGTIFIFKNGRQTLRYLDIGQVDDLLPGALKENKNKPCPGITSTTEECKPPTIQIFGGGGIGAAGNAIVGNDGSILAVDIVRRGNGYKYPPLVSARDNCAIGSGAVLTATLGCIPQEKEKAKKQKIDLCSETEVGYGQIWDANGQIIGDWDPKNYFRPSTLRETLSGDKESSGSGQGRGQGPGRQDPFEAGVFTPSNPRRIGNRTTYDLTYRLKIDDKILARIEGYKPGDLVKVTWNITGQGDIGTGFRFTFIEKNPGKNPGPRHEFDITEAPVKPGNKDVVRRVKPNVNYRVKVTSDGGRVQNDPNKPFVDRDDPPGIQKGTLKEGKYDYKQLRNASVTNQKSNAAFADAVRSANDSNDMRIVAFSVDLPKLPKPEEPVKPKKEVCGVVTEIIVIDPGVGFPTTSPPPPGISTTIRVTPFTPTGDITITGIGTGPPGIGFTGPIIPGIGTFITPTPPPPGIGTFVGIGTSGPGIGTFITGIGTGPIGFTFTGGGGGGGPTPSGPPTGINATFIPQFEVVRDPIVIDGSKLLQVTDLVGLKQTGYVNGRAYYGAVYYDNGIRYAGYYETVGEPVQVYDTLRESIIAQVTTPPSAILRQGTDIRSNDPLLNIPGTVQSTLSSRSIVGAGDYFPPSVPFVQEIIEGTYPVALRLKSVIVLNPGINYNVTDKIRITPSNGAVLEPVFGSFGRVIKVAVIDPGFGFTEYPRIEMFTPL